MEKISPKISVIIPVYNAMPYLKDTLFTLRAQTYKNFEVLLIDDGSKDESPALCDKYAREDSRFRVFHRPNSGVSVSRNFGLDQAAGEYIVFCDSDDIYEKNSLELMLDVYDQYNPDLVISGYCRYYDVPGKPRQEYSLSKYSISIMKSTKELATLFFRPETNLFGISIWAKMYRAGIIQQYHIRFPEDISYEEDCCFNLEYMRHVVTTGVLKDVLYRYRQREVSLSKGYRSDAYPFLVNGFRCRKAFIEELGLEKNVPALRTIFLVATIMTYRKIWDSDLTRERRLEEFGKILAFQEALDSAKNGLRSPTRLTRALSKATLKLKPQKIDNVFRMWAIASKVKETVGKVRRALCALKKHKGEK